MAWLVTMAPALSLSLPIIRAFGEAEEHDYAAANDNFAREDVLHRTFNNDGAWNSFLHPFGDKYHVEHHQFPGVPQYHLRRLHHLLLTLPEYRAEVRVRLHGLDTPVSYSDVTGTPANDNDDSGTAEDGR